VLFMKTGAVKSRILLARVNKIYTHFSIEILAKQCVGDLHLMSSDISEFRESWYRQVRRCVIGVNRITKHLDSEEHFVKICGQRQGINHLQSC